MASTETGYLKATRMRLTKVDSCGRPVAGPCSTLVTKGMFSVKLTPTLDEGEPLQVKNTSGEFCINQPACPQLLGQAVELIMCKVSPDFVTMWNPNFRKVLDASGRAVGWRGTRSVSCTEGLAVELWTSLDSEDLSCYDPEAPGTWGYMTLPWLSSGVQGGELTFTDGEAPQWTYTGSTKVNSLWNVGPYNVVRNGAGTPVPLLTPFAADEDHQVMTTTVAPPEPTQGCIALTLPTPPTETITEVVTDDTRMTAQVAWSNVVTGGGVTIDWGDGSPTVTGAETATATHQYALPGSYVVTVWDTDTPLARSTRVATVPFGPSLNPDPVVTITKDAAVVSGLGVKVKVNNTTYGNVIVNFGDGTAEVVNVGDNTAESLHTYAGAGTYTVTARDQTVPTAIGSAAVTVPLP